MQKQSQRGRYIGRHSVTHRHTKKWRNTDSDAVQTKKDAQIHVRTHTDPYRDSHTQIHHAHTGAHSRTHIHTQTHTGMFTDAHFHSHKRYFLGNAQTHTQRHTDAEPDRHRQAMEPKAFPGEAFPPPEPRHPSFAVPLGTLRTPGENSWDIS